MRKNGLRFKNCEHNIPYWYYRTDGDYGSSYRNSSRDLSRDLRLPYSKPVTFDTHGSIREWTAHVDPGPLIFDLFAADCHDLWIWIGLMMIRWLQTWLGGNEMMKMQMCSNRGGELLLYSIFDIYSKIEWTLGGFCVVWTFDLRKVRSDTFVIV